MSMTDRYHIIKLILKDRLGGVYLAKDTILQHEVIFRHFDVNDDETQTEHWQEAFTAYSSRLIDLRHLNLISVYDAAIEDDEAVLITQLLETTKLSDILQKNALSTKETISMAKDLLMALQESHAKEIFHGAMHTGSIERLTLENGDHRYLIGDLGIKHLSSITTGNSNNLEDPILIPPELYEENAQPDARADLFMIGQLCYTTLVGGHPFAQHSPEKCAKAYKNNELPPLKDFVKNIPPAFTQWIAQLTAGDSDQRPRSASEAIDSLQKCNQTPSSNITTEKKSTSPSEIQIPPTQTSQKSTPQLPSEKKTKGTLFKIIGGVAALFILVGGLILGLRSDTKSNQQQTSSESTNSSNSTLPTLGETKLVNSLKNFKKPVIVDIETPKTIDWLVTTGAHAATDHRKKNGGPCMLAVTKSDNFQEYKFTNNPICLRIKKTNVIPRSATNSTKYYAQSGQGWNLTFRVPAKYNGPLTVTFYMTLSGCDITFDISDAKHQTTASLTTQSSTPGVFEIPISIPNAKAGTFYTIKTLATPHSAKQAFTIGLNGLRIEKP
jgi:serine/threonine-protein kinase